jgi:uncharacterized membrane protein YedE/YeeE
MAGGKRLNPRLESLLVFAVVIAAAALSAFIRSRATGQPFALNWSVALLNIFWNVYFGVICFKISTTTFQNK